MKRKLIKSIIKECIKSYLTESKIQDPTKEEMLNYLKSQFGREEGFEDDAEVAMYWFANFNHGGQWSNLYSVLSTSPYTPGRIARGPEKDSMEEMMYQALEDKFGNKIQNLEDPDPDEWRQWNQGEKGLKEKMTTRNELDAGTMKAVNLQDAFDAGIPKYDAQAGKPWKLIDNNFYQISNQLAGKLAGGKLPREGYERIVKAPQGFSSESGWVWLARTKTWGKMVWSIRPAHKDDPYLGNKLKKEEREPEAFYRDAQDRESEYANARKELEVIKKAGLGKQYEKLMNGIFRLPLSEFDKRALEIEKLKQKAFQIVKGSIKEQSTTASSTPGGQEGGTIRTPAWVSKNRYGSKKAMDAARKYGKIVKSIS